MIWPSFDNIVYIGKMSENSVSNDEKKSPEKAVRPAKDKMLRPVTDKAINPELSKEE
jgi:hypothetical protein